MLATTLTFIIILSVLVLVHEIGHFLLAKKAGIKVEEFGFGLPPRIIGKKIGETIYSLNWLMFGGFVRLKGEELEDGYDIRSEKAKRSFWAQSKKARTAVIVAGVTANFLLAIGAFTAVYSATGIPERGDQVKILGIVKDSPADLVGLKEGDIVVSFAQQKITSTETFIKVVDEMRGQKASLEIRREENNPCLEKVSGPPVGGSAGGLIFGCRDGNLVVDITPRTQPPEKEGPLGVVISDMTTKKYPLWQMPFRGAVVGFQEAIAWVGLILGSLGKMLADLITQGAVPKEIAGPLGIYQITGEVARTGILNIIHFLGILSVNLAIVNILPFPALDGGRLMFVVYEAVMRRRPKPSFERRANAAGMAFLLFLIMLVTINDLLRWASSKNFSQFFQNLWPF